MILIFLSLSGVASATLQVQKDVWKGGFTSISDWKDLLEYYFENSGFDCTIPYSTSYDNFESCRVSLKNEYDEYHVLLNLYPNDNGLYFWCSIDDYERDKESCAALLSNIPWICLALISKESNPGIIEPEYKKAMSVISGIWTGSDLESQYYYENSEGGGMIVYYLSPDNTTDGAIYITLVLNNK